MKWNDNAMCKKNDKQQKKHLLRKKNVMCSKTE